MQVAIAAFAAFNLVCRVQASGHALPAVSEEVITYRVDTMLGRWCLGNCPVAQPLVAMSVSEIVFEQTFSDYHLPGHAVRVERLTGRFTEVLIDLDLREWPMKVGQCERAMFSGFPPGSLPSYGSLRVEVPTRVEGIRPAGSRR